MFFLIKIFFMIKINNNIKHNFKKQKWVQLVKAVRSIFYKKNFFFIKLWFVQSHKIIKNNHFFYKFFLFFYKKNKKFFSECCFYSIKSDRRCNYTFNFFFRKKVFKHFLFLPNFKKNNFLKKIEKFHFFLIECLLVLLNYY